MNYTLAGRVANVLEESVAGRITSSTNLRAIVALGRAAPDSRTPLMHTSTDRTFMFLDKLAPHTQASVDQFMTDKEGSSAQVSSTSGAKAAIQVFSFAGFSAGAAAYYTMTIF